MKVTSYRRTSLILLLSTMAMLIAGLSPHASRAAEKHTAQATAVSGSEYDTFLATALADQKVVRLQEFLHARGFTTNAVQADVTKIDLDGKKSAVVALIPFMDSTGTAAARIAFWDGHVDGVRDQDAVAMQGEDAVFAVRGNDVTTLTKGQLYKQLRNPCCRSAVRGPRVLQRTRNS